VQKINESITFSCPGCKENFEFDTVGEYELVPCPICGTEFMTVKKGQTLQLESFEFSLSDDCLALK
jgi:Zn finger protein HypA/HybF involved in hydrogenase expression